MVGILRLYWGAMGVGHLPDTGGILDQPVIMLEALSMMASFEAQISDPKADPLDETGQVDQAEKERRAIASWGVNI